MTIYLRTNNLLNNNLKTNLFIHSILFVVSMLCTSMNEFAMTEKKKNVLKYYFCVVLTGISLKRIRYLSNRIL